MLLPVEIASSAFSSNKGPDMQESMLSPKTCCRQLFPGALIDRSCRGGRPGIVAGRKILISSMSQMVKKRYSRESMAISCTVVIGPSSEMLAFLRRTMGCSLGLIRSAVAINDRSFSFVPFSPAPVDCDVSASAFLWAPAIDNLSLAGNSWYLRGSVG